MRWISNLTNKRCWCNSPSRRRRRPACGGLLARNPQAALASLLTRRTIVSSLYPMTGQIPMVLVPPLGGRYPPRARNGVGRANHPMRHLRRNQQTKMRLHPNRIRARSAKTAEAILIATRNELYGKDNPPVQEVRARLLGLDPDVTPTDAQINASPRFALCSAAVERDAPDIITDHWMPYLEENDRLADCSPEEFNATEGWVPLYTPEKLEEHLPAALSAFGSAKPPRLTAVVPPNFPSAGQRVHANELSPKGMPAEDVPDDKWEARQVAFCPYCGVTNDNAETGLNHVQKHLDVMLVCGGCHTKSVCLGQALQKHMKDNCPAILAILGRPGAARNSPARLFVAPLKGTVRCCPGYLKGASGNIPEVAVNIKIMEEKGGGINAGRIPPHPPSRKAVAPDR